MKKKTGKKKPTTQEKKRPIPPKKKRPKKLGRKKLAVLRKQIERRKSRIERTRPHPLIRWLSGHERIAEAIVWHDIEDAELPYRDWANDQRQELLDKFDEMRAALMGGASYQGLPEAPALAAVPEATESAITRLDRHTARQYYMAHVAQCIVIELEQVVPWSLESLSDSELSWLLNSWSLFDWDSEYSTHRVNPYELGRATPGDPLRTYYFLEVNDLVRSTKRGTIGRVIEWCRDNLSHFLYYPVASNMVDHWQYEGCPPVERMISGTTHAAYGSAHWTAGCWGTVGFLRAVLRTVNIATNLVERCGHALPHFIGDDCFMTHGDDPYTAINGSKPYSGEQLLINRETFDAWFDRSLPADQMCTNIGRQLIELALVHLPTAVLTRHCADLADGGDHDSSRVYEVFYRHYSVSALEAANLWQRLDDKIASLGGCDSIP